MVDKKVGELPYWSVLGDEVGVESEEVSLNKWLHFKKSVVHLFCAADC